MTVNEKVDKVKILVNDSTISDEAILLYLSLAENKIMERCYPIRREGKTLPSRYDYIQIELASRYIFRRGVEGQTSSSENGVSRGYGSVNDEDLLKEVVQVIGR